MVGFVYILTALFARLVNNVHGCHLTDIEYRWSLGNPPRTVIAKPAPKECMENGILYKGKGKKRYQVEGGSQCKSKCQENEECTWFSFEPPNNCWTMREKTTPYLPKIKKGAMSGPKVCPGECTLEKNPFCGSDGIVYTNECFSKKRGIDGTDGECNDCLERNQKYEGSGVNKTSKNPNECQGLCAADASCNFFTWVQPSNCSLLNTKSDEVPTDGYVSGPKVCDEDIGNEAKCIESDVIYTGFPLKDKTTGTNNYGPTSDGLACQALCQNTEGCQWFNWDMGECWLKTQKGTKKEKSGSSTGPKTCPSTS